MTNLTNKILLFIAGQLVILNYDHLRTTELDDKTLGQFKELIQLVVNEGKE